jgi:hypothetical protein
MAWKANTLAKALMRVAFEIAFGILPAMTHRIGYAKEKSENAPMLGILNVARNLEFEND